MPSGAWANGMKAATTNAEVWPRPRTGRREERRQREDHERRHRAAAPLDHQADAKEPAQAPPLLGRHVAEPVLDDRLLDRRVEEQLQESGDGESQREDAEPFRAETRTAMRVPRSPATVPP